MARFLKTAAADLKQLKAGHVLEIAGYTDNTGDAALNLALSQKRAEAVREALIKYGSLTWTCWSRKATVRRIP